MPNEPRYEPACQTTGVRRWRCPACGRDTSTRVRAGHYRVKCSNNATCGREWEIGSVFYEVTTDNNARRASDAAWVPDIRGHDSLSGNSSLSGKFGKEGSPFDAMTSLSGNADERCIFGGIWRSAEPVTLIMPTELTNAKLYKDKQTEELWVAMSVAAGTRMLAQPLLGSSSDRIYVGHKEWKARMELVTDKA